MKLDFKYLCERLRQGDESAGDEFDKILAMRFRASFARFGPWDKDLLQELKMRVVEAIYQERIEHPEFLIAYARGVAEKLIAGATKKHLTAVNQLIPIDSVVIGDGPRQERQALQQERVALFWRVLGGMSPSDAAIILRYYFKHEEPARIMMDLNLKPSFFERKLRRVVEELRARFREAERVRPDPGGGIVALGVAA